MGILIFDENHNALLLVIDLERDQSQFSTVVETSRNPFLKEVV